LNEIITALEADRDVTVVVFDSAVQRFLSDSILQQFGRASLCLCNFQEHRHERMTLARGTRELTLEVMSAFRLGNGSATIRRMQ
jgi:hypothetical protein